MDCIDLHLLLDIDENQILCWKPDSGRTEDTGTILLRTIRTIIYKN
jgi:hypothetical protein